MIANPRRSRDGRHRKPGLVLLAGQLFDFTIRPEEWRFIVAADGGARHALEQNVVPDHVVGDLDSLSRDDEKGLISAGVSIERLVRAKDAMTDGEAALQWAVQTIRQCTNGAAERRMTATIGDDVTTTRDAPTESLHRSDDGYQEQPMYIVIAGGLGGRFDHSLGSVVLLEQLSQAGLSGYVTDGRQEVHLLQEGLTVVGDPGDQLSIIPLTPTVTGVGVSGVRWPLRDATLQASSTLTLSNELIGRTAHLSVKTGRAVVVRTPRRYV